MAKLGDVLFKGSVAVLSTVSLLGFVKYFNFAVDTLHALADRQPDAAPVHAETHARFTAIGDGRQRTTARTANAMHADVERQFGFVGRGESQLERSHAPGI